MTAHRNHIVFLALALLLPAVSMPMYAQRLFHADVSSKTVSKGKMQAADKEIYYTKGGNLTIRWNRGLATYYTLSTPFGFTDIYYPASKESMTLDPQMFKMQDELLYVFAEGGAEDMGLGREDFVLKSSKKDGSFTVRRYEPRKGGGMCAWVELVSGADFLPVYVAYYNKKGKIITKTYLSGYTSVKGFAFPMRVTEISYLGEKKDSTVRLDIYRNLEVDVPNELFGFHIPSDAVPVDFKEGLKAAGKKAK